MNKLVKGSIAGAAGIALLLGGAGTLAYWNDNATLAAGTITAGELDITAGGAGVWTSGPDTIDAASFLIVPGDTIVFTDDIAVNAEGDNLSFELSTNIDSLIEAADIIPGTTVTKSFAVTEGVTTVPAPAVAGDPYTLDEGSYTVTATVTVVFPFDAANGNKVGQGASLNLSTATINVKQVLLP